MIAQLITDRLNENQSEFREKYFSGNPWEGDWTLLMKNIIADLGRKLPKENKYSFSNISIASNKIVDDNGGEFMFDLVWYEMQESPIDGLHYMKSIPLVLESEISQKGIGAFKYDFEKLLVANASTKVMITIKKSDIDIEQKLRCAQNAVDLMTGIDVVYVIYWDEAVVANNSIPHFYIKTIAK